MDKKGVRMSRGDDFEKRLQYISEEEEAAVLSRMKRPSQSWLRMARHLILSSFLFEIVAVGYAVLTTTGSVDLDPKNEGFSGLTHVPLCLLLIFCILFCSRQLRRNVPVSPTKMF